MTFAYRGFTVTVPDAPPYICTMESSVDDRWTVETNKTTQKSAALTMRNFIDGYCEGQAKRVELESRDSGERSEPGG